MLPFDDYINSTKRTSLLRTPTEGSDYNVKTIWNLFRFNGDHSKQLFNCIKLLLPLNELLTETSNTIESINCMVLFGRYYLRNNNTIQLIWTNTTIMGTHRSWGFMIVFIL